MNWARRSGTIAVVARELERALPENSPEIEDVAPAARAGRALPRHHRAPGQSGRGHAGRHRAPAAGRVAGRYRRRLIAARMSRSASPSTAATADTRSPRSGGRPNCCTGWATSSRTPPTSPQPLVAVEAQLGRAVPAHLRGRRRPGLCAGNFRARWASPTSPRAPAITPWAKARWARKAPLDEHEGMGLGFFIAKILLEQTGGVVKADNPPGGGAQVSHALGAGRDRRAPAARPSPKLD